MDFNAAMSQWAVVCIFLFPVNGSGWPDNSAAEIQSRDSLKLSRARQGRGGGAKVWLTAVIWKWQSGLNHVQFRRWWRCVVCVLCLRDVTLQPRWCGVAPGWCSDGIRGSGWFCCSSSRVNHTLIVFQVFSEAAASLKLRGFWIVMSHRRPPEPYQPDTLSKSHAGCLFFPPLRKKKKKIRSALFNLLTARKI